MPQKCIDPHSSSTKNISAVQLHRSHPHSSSMKNLMHRMRPAPSHGLRAGHTGRPCGIGSAEDVLHEELSFVRRWRHHGRYRPHIPLLLTSVQRLATSPTKLCVGQGKVNTMMRSSSPTLRRPPSSVTMARSCWCKPRAWWWHGNDLLSARRQRQQE
jgi:hypothetical protein